MSKKMIVWDFIAAILIIIEIIVVNLIMKKIGMIAYILLDALAIAAILFVVNYISHKMSKKGNMKTSILNSIILVLVYLTISAGYGKISYGIQANQNLNMMSMSENQIQLIYPYELALGQALFIGENRFQVEQNQSTEQQAGEAFKERRSLRVNGYAYPFISEWVLEQTLSYLAEF